MNNITNHMTTLEWSKKLKEVGLPQDSMFYWVKHTQTAFPDPTVKFVGQVNEWNEDEVTGAPAFRLNVICSAYLISELIELAGEDFYSLILLNSKAWLTRTTLLSENYEETPIDALSALVYEKYKRLKNV